MAFYFGVNEVNCMEQKTLHESFEELKTALLVFLLELGRLLWIDKLVDLLIDGD